MPKTPVRSGVFTFGNAAYTLDDATSHFGSASGPNKIVGISAGPSTVEQFGSPYVPHRPVPRRPGCCLTTYDHFRHTRGSGRAVRGA
jgi:hypothetical protein